MFASNKPAYILSAFTQNKELDKTSANQIGILGAANRNQVSLTQGNTVTGAGDTVESGIASVHLRAYHLEGNTS